MLDDFLSPKKKPEKPRKPTKGLDLSSMDDIKTPRQLSASIFTVYSRLGGDEWLLKQAKKDPKGFIALLTKLLPKNTDGLEPKNSTSAVSTRQEIEQELKRRQIPLPGAYDENE